MEQLEPVLDKAAIRQATKPHKGVARLSRESRRAGIRSTWRRGRRSSVTARRGSATQYNKIT